MPSHAHSRYAEPVRSRPSKPHIRRRGQASLLQVHDTTRWGARGSGVFVVNEFTPGESLIDKDSRSLNDDGRNRPPYKRDARGPRGKVSGMSASLVRITAPSRLHFGLWSLGGERPGVRQFGGVGAMIERPGLKLTIVPAAEFAAEGRLADRAATFARRWAAFHSRDLPRCSILVEAAPPDHVGLGTGTQLGLSIAAGLNAFAGLPSQTPPELALSVGRGLRSAVGTYGFVMGGLIVEQGKLPDEPISPLDCRIDLPAEWRFVLIRHQDATGLSGDDEAGAMADLPPVPAEVTADLIAEVRERLVPAAATADFQAFAACLYRYGNLSGQCFAAQQGGPYNGPILTRLVEQIRDLGFEGVGQSSWGPTIFVAVPSEKAARALIAQLRESGAASRLHLQASAPCNAGVRIECLANRSETGSV